MNAGSSFVSGRQQENLTIKIMAMIYRYTAKTQKEDENKSEKPDQELSSETPTNEEIEIYMLYQSLNWRGAAL
jgi:hypothetical protein